MSAYRRISPSICLPPPPARLLCSLSTSVSGFSSLEIRGLAGGHLSLRPFLFCSAPVSCLRLVCPSLVCPMRPTVTPPPQSNKQTNKDFPCWFHYEAKHTLRTRAALKDAGADWCRAHHVIIDNNDNRACEKQFVQWRKMQKAAGEGAWGCWPLATQSKQKQHIAPMFFFNG